MSTAQNAFQPSEAERIDQIRELVQQLDLTTPEGEQRAYDLLRTSDLDTFWIFGLKQAHVSEDVIQWAELRLAELRASGDVP
jgi:hypothetical protein